MYVYNKVLKSTRNPHLVGKMVSIGRTVDALTVEVKHDVKIYVEELANLSKDTWYDVYCLYPVK